MIAFDTALVTFDIVRLKTITTALGGSMSVIDESLSTDKKEVLKRIELPLAVARDFIQRHGKITRYLKPVYIGIARYGNLVISLERHPLSTFGELESESIDGTMRRWEPDMVTHFEQISKAIELSANKWYFDGRYAYAFAQECLTETLNQGQKLTDDGQFRKIPTQTFDLNILFSKNSLNISERSCLGFVASRGAFGISPPIWKNLDDVGATQLTRANSSGMVDDDSGLAIGKFDTINDTTSVNLNFALKAASEVGKVFGYEAVEPLQLSRLMIELCTVNLPNLPKEIKASYCIGMKFTHAIAWLMGLLRRSDTLETIIMVRSLLKYLTKRGIFRTNMFNSTAVFRAGKTVQDVAVIDVEAVGLEETLGQTLRGVIEATKKKPHIVLKANQQLPLDLAA
jgi:hypothetical protein